MNTRGNGEVGFRKKQSAKWPTRKSLWENWADETLLARDGPMLAKKLLKLITIREGSEQTHIFILLKRCSDFFLEIITDQVFLRRLVCHENIFSSNSNEKIVLISILVISRFVGFSRVSLELFIKRILPVTGYKATFCKPGFRRTPGFRVYRLSGNDLWYAEIRRLEKVS